MSEKIENKNAAQRKTYVGQVFDKGENLVKRETLNSMKKEWKKLHEEGDIHIHDLDAYNYTYNCLTFNILDKFPYESLKKYDDRRKISSLFEHYKNMISKVGNEQSGGMGFGNFDIDTAKILKNLDVNFNIENEELLRDRIWDFIVWCNNSHERMGQVSYYVTLNVGLANDELSRKICEMVIDEFGKQTIAIHKPNIVFKIKNGINKNEKDVNRYLLDKALECTSRKMIPTYLLCDCKLNKNKDPAGLSIMGCRTRVVDDIFGESGSRGRGNIGNITINLPRLAFRVMESYIHENIDEKMMKVKQEWVKIAEEVVKILLDRYEKIINVDKEYFSTVKKYSLWIKDMETESLNDVFKHGTLSIGFIGLCEMIEILFGHKYYENKDTYNEAQNFVKFMREYTDNCIKKYNYNFSLLATSGELISGRFPQKDKKKFNHNVLGRDHYTNSFHVNVDSNLSAIEKVSMEGPFHEFCNGGSITYIEIEGAPLGNNEGLEEVIDHANVCGVHYLGFNFPIDCCTVCEKEGIFDSCPECGSKKIKRIRRVSGYLEELEYFVSGKKDEVKYRGSN